MLAHTRTRKVAPRVSSIVRTRGGVVDWQSTNNNIDTTSKDIRAWKNRLLGTIHTRVESGTFSSACVKGAPVKACMTEKEWKVNLWIMQEWDRFVARWNHLVATSCTGGLKWICDDDDELEDYKAELAKHRATFEAMTGEKLTTPLPNKPMPGDPKPDTGVSGIPWTGILLVGGLIAVASIMRSLT